MTTIELPDRWLEQQRQLFLRLYRHSVKNQAVMTHPDADNIMPTDWDTVCWNFSWLAAEMSIECPPLEHVDEDNQTLAIEGDATQ